MSDTKKIELLNEAKNFLDSGNIILAKQNIDKVIASINYYNSDDYETDLINSVGS